MPEHNLEDLSIILGSSLATASSKTVLEKAINHHSVMCVENSEDEFDALILVKELNDDINTFLFYYGYFLL